MAPRPVGPGADLLLSPSFLPFVIPTTPMREVS